MTDDAKLRARQSSVRALGRVILVFAVTLTACTTWRRDVDVLSAPIPQRRPVQIWSGRRGLVAHGVQVRGDSVRAVPQWNPPACDTCARYFALSAIDSVRVHQTSTVRTAGLVAVLIAWAVITAGIAGTGGPGS